MKVIRFSALCMAVLLTACDEPATNQTYVHPAGSYDFLVEATKEGPLLLVVQGKAFEIQRQDFETEVADLLASAIQRRQFAVTTDPAQAPQPSLYVVMTFNGGRELNGQAQCRGETRGGDPRGADARFDVTASFCSKTGRLATVTGWVAKLQGRDDEKYPRLIRQIARDLFVEQHQDK